MDVRYLETFLAVVDSGSFAEAGRRLDLPPTTVTQQIRALEQELHIGLVSRSGRTVRPTVAGARVVPHAREVVRAARELRSSASETGLPAGPLRLGATPSVMTGLLPPVLRAWKLAQPEIELFLDPDTSSTLLARVTAGELDAAVIVHPSFALPKTCEWHALRSESLILLTPAALQVTDVLSTIAQQPFIRYDRKVTAGKMADDYLRGHGIAPLVQFELDGLEHIAQFVAQGLGISVVPDWPVIGQPDARLRRWALPEPCPRRSVGIVWQRASSRSPLAAAFYKVMAV